MNLKKTALAFLASAASVLAIDSVSGLSVSTPHDSGTVTNDDTVTFTWTPPSGVAKYYYKLDTNSTNYDLAGGGDYTILNSSGDTVTATASSSGNYYFHIVAVDAANGTSAPTTVQVSSEIDLDSGTVTMSPDGGSITTSTNTITLSGSEDGTIYYTTDGSDPTTSSSTYSTSLTLGVGTTIKAFLKDTAGNSGTVTGKTFTITNNPTITQSDDSEIDGQTVATVSTYDATPITSLKVSGTDLTRYQYKIDDASYTTVGDIDTEIDLSSESLSSGSHTVYVKAGDEYNFQTEATSVTFTVDNTPPSDLTMSVNSVDANESNSSTITFADSFDFTLSSNDSAATIKYTFGSTKPAKTSGSWSGTTYTGTPVSSGESGVSVSSGEVANVIVNMVSIDTAGNAAEESITFVIDKETPTITMPDTESFSAKIDVALSTTDSTATVYYLVNDSDCSTNSASTIKTIGDTLSSSTVTIGEDAQGQFDSSYRYLCAFAEDVVGNQSDVEMTTYTYNSSLVTINISGVAEAETIATSSANGATAVSSLTVSGANFSYYKYKTTTDGTYSDAKTLASQSTIDITSLSDGDYNLTVGGASTSDGNFTQNLKSITFSVDNTAPSGLALSTPPTGGFASTHTATITVPTNESSTVYYTVDGTEATDQSSTSTTVDKEISLAQTTTIRAIAIDATGNKSSELNATYTKDTTPPDAPSISLSGDTATVTSASDANVTYYRFDLSTSSSDFYDGSDKTSGTEIYTSPVTMSDGDTIYVISKDIVGNFSSIASEQYTADSGSGSSGSSGTSGSSSSDDSTDSSDDSTDTNTTDDLSDTNTTDDSTDTNTSDDSTDDTSDSGDSGSGDDSTDSGSTDDSSDTNTTDGSTDDSTDDSSDTNTTDDTSDSGSGDDTTDDSTDDSTDSGSSDDSSDSNTTDDSSGITYSTTEEGDEKITIEITDENGEKIDVEVISEVNVTTTQTTEGIQNVATVTNDDGTSSNITILTDSNGTTQNTIILTKDDNSTVEIEVDSQISGTDTTIKSDGTISTTAQKDQDDGTTTQAIVETKTDGTVENTLIITNEDNTTVQTKAESNIEGTDTTIKSDGSIEQKTPEVTTQNGKKVEVVSVINTEGKATTTISVTDPSTGETKSVEIPQSQPGAEVTVYYDESAGTVLVRTKTKLTTQSIEIRKRDNNEYN